MEKSLNDILWVTVSATLVFLMQAGFLCLESGLTRSKNNINVAIKNLTDFGVSAFSFWIFGFALMFGRSWGGWIGTTDFMPEVGHGGMWQAAFFLFETMFCSTAVTIMSGAVAERMRFSSYVIVATAVSSFIYPIFGHWAWNGISQVSGKGWIERAGFVDFAGSTVVHSVGGWVSLAVLMILGSRAGRFPKDEPPREIAGANMPLAILGTMLLWFGWFGFNGGSTLALNNQVPKIIVNTVLAGAAGLIVALGLSWWRKGRADVGWVMNGSLAGLVAITASCHAVTVGSAVIIGGVGAVVMWGSDRLLNHFRIDDAVSAIPVHLGAGIWGTLAVALFGNSDLLATGLDRSEQLRVQAFGIIVCFIWTFGITYLLLRVINRWMPLRVTREQEYIGLNVSEHGARTDLLDLFRVMDEQSRTGNLSLRAPVDPLTEVGQIAQRYNEVMEALERAVTRTEAIVRTAMDGIITFDQQGLILTLNPAAEAIFGYQENQIQKQPVTQLLSDWVNSVKAWNVETLKHSNVQTFHGRRADGSIFPIEVTITEAQVAGELFYTAVFRDITEQEQAEAEKTRLIESLQESEARLQAILDNSVATLISLKDTQGRYLLINRHYEEVFGVNREVAIGKTDYDLFPQELADMFWENDQKVVAARTALEFEEVIPQNDEMHTYLATKFPIARNGGIPYAICGILTDITERARSQEELQKAKESAEAANRAKSSFLANMSHELRTPLNAIIGYSEMLQEDAEEFGYEDIVPDLDKIRAAGKHLLSLINDILDISKIEAGRMDLYLETFDVGSLIGEVVNTVTPLVEKKSNTLEVFISPNVRTMHADLTKVRQALFNLLSNAAKFTENGKITLEVRSQDTPEDIDSEFCLVDAGSWLIFQVKDTGIGMSREQLERVFEPFTQADASTTRKYGGTGLGLAITQKFCQMMGGEINVESELEVGSTFTIRMPVEVDSSARKNFEMLESTNVEESANVSTFEPKINNARILVIDDDEAVRDLIARRLGKEGFQIQTATTGDQGLELARTKRPDLIILDVLMQGMSGWEVLSVLKADPNLADVPVIMSTITDDKNQGFTLGASEFLTKPIDIKRLGALLGKYGRSIVTESSAPTRILVVEDDPATREMLRRLLEKEGYLVTEAENGRVALEQVGKSCPDLILLDLMMPEMDGFQVIKELRKQGQPGVYYKLPIIVLTAMELTPEDYTRLNGYVEQILQKGAYTRDELLREVQELAIASLHHFPSK